MCNINWNISGSCFVLSSVENLLLVSVSGLVGDDGDISVLGRSDCSVGGLVDGVEPGVLLGSVLSLMLNSVLGVEDGVVPGLFLFPVEHLVVVAVPGLGLISVVGDGVRSLKDLDFGSVAVLLLLSVEDFVVRLVGGEWHILVVGLRVVAVDSSWLERVPMVGVWSIVDLVIDSVSDLFFGSVFHLNLRELGGDWNLSGPDFDLLLGLNRVLDFVVDNFDVTELGLLTVLGVGVFVLVVAELDGVVPDGFCVKIGRAHV